MKENTYAEKDIKAGVNTCQFFFHLGQFRGLSGSSGLFHFSGGITIVCSWLSKSVSVGCAVIISGSGIPSRLSEELVARDVFSVSVMLFCLVISWYLYHVSCGF